MTTTYQIKRNRREIEPTQKAELLKNFKKAIRSLKDAQAALDEVGSDWHNWGSVDAQEYAKQIAEILSCDHGEAGLEHLIETLKKL
jgi:hypothetical protein